jgi:tRNA threonylcarbamoyladenosine biosynthesis protein TsaE
MIVVTRESSSCEFTAALASGLADIMQPGDVIALEGDLGAGKTTFTRELANALGVHAGTVSSPTFVIVNVYPVPTRAGSSTPAIARLIHIDAYRVSSDEDLEPLGWDQLFNTATKQAASDAVAIVEWPQRIAHALPDSSRLVRIRIEAVGESQRQFTFELPDAFQSRPLAAWFTSRPPVRCPKSQAWTSPTAATYPFANERARSSDLFGWLTDSYTVSKPAEHDEGT